MVRRHERCSIGGRCGCSHSCRQWNTTTFIVSSLNRWWRKRPLAGVVVMLLFGWRRLWVHLQFLSVEESWLLPKWIRELSVSIKMGCFWWASVGANWCLFVSCWLFESVSIDLSVGRQQCLSMGSNDRWQYQMGSLTGAVHSLKCNENVLRWAHRGQKPRVEYKGKSLLDFDFQYEYKPRKCGLMILYIGLRISG